MSKIKEIVEKLEKNMSCNCNLDRWQPTRETGHSRVCRIHKEAINRQEDNEHKKPTI